MAQYAKFSLIPVKNDRVYQVVPGSWQHEKVNSVFNPRDEGALCSEDCFMMTTRLEQTASEKTVARDAVKAIYFLRLETKQSHLLQDASRRWMNASSMKNTLFHPTLIFREIWKPPRPIDFSYTF